MLYNYNSVTYIRAGRVLDCQKCDILIVTQALLYIAWYVQTRPQVLCIPRYVLYLYKAKHLFLCYNYVLHLHVYVYLPYSTYMVVFSVSNPMILSALHLKTSPLRTSVIVIVVEVFPPVG